MGAHFAYVKEGRAWIPFTSATPGPGPHPRTIHLDIVTRLGDVVRDAQSSG
jgi:hypothetical protein